MRADCQVTVMSDKFILCVICVLYVCYMCVLNLVLLIEGNSILINNPEYDS